MNPPLKPFDKQRAAANPKQSVWVTANAGSGKTHVLAHRVIRLMLEGADPASILCLTYTKAAAAEMAQRVHEILASWVTMPKIELVQALAGIGAPASGEQRIAQARRLFTRALETPGGLKIQTIHAFCERLLQLFPAEAGVIPGFSVADERSAALMMDRALELTLAMAESGDDEKLAESLAIASRYLQASQLADCISQIAGERQRFSAPQFDGAFVAAGLQRLRGAFQLSDTDTAASLLDRLASDNAFWDCLLDVLSHGGKKANDMALDIARARKTDPPSLEEWRGIIFNADGAPRSISTKQILALDPEFDRRFASIAAEVSKASACECLLATEALLTIAVRAFQAYDAEKRRAGNLDFDDLIRRTRELLTARHAAQWVLYKLDRGLAHVLVDEAQDTNPGQWDILGALTGEFFAGEGRRAEADRTIFVVGDRKQSIYGFQGADVNAFEAAESGFASRVKGAGQAFDNVPLTLSFRSTQEVLAAVDAVFGKSSAALEGLEGARSPYPPHQAHRPERGIFEIWPLVETGEKDGGDVWLPLMERSAEQSRHRLLAQEIARRIGSWVGKRRLTGGEPVRPVDILILLRSRGRLFEAILFELQAAGIPIAGADRLKLADNIAVLDLMALLQFCLLAEDDYALACVLKSPLVPHPLDDGQLTMLAANRGSSTLWARLAGATDGPSRADALWLATQRDKMRRQRPFEFLSQIVVERRAAILARLGSETSDAMDALLQAALEHETAEAPSYPGFLYWFKSGDTRVKRDMDQSAGGVRVMTIHGSKGLEAPIVILPIDVNAGQGGAANQILMPVLAGFGPFPFLNLSKRPLDSVPKWKDDRISGERQESHRLLYVALTRARDELYVCGCSSGKKAREDNWYDLVDGARPAGMREIWENGVLVARRLGNAPGQAMRVDDPPPAAPPPWFHAAYTEPEARQRRPEKGAQDDGAAARGTFLHKLLQELPSLAPEKRIAFANRIAERHGIGQAHAEAMAKLTMDKNFQTLFDANGRAEAPVSARLYDGKLVVEGRIDRLILGETETVVIDYKSGPSTVISEAHAYALQLARYRAAVEAAFPGKPVKAAILWLDAPRLDWIGKDVLDRALARLLDSTTA
jgi:ATP-dependent helicase/nuclease subunit A